MSEEPVHQEMQAEEAEADKSDDNDGWIEIRDGLKIDKDGHIAGGLKFK